MAESQPRMPRRRAWTGAILLATSFLIAWVGRAFSGMISGWTISTETGMLLTSHALVWHETQLLIRHVLVGIVFTCLVLLAARPLFRRLGTWALWIAGLFLIVAAWHCFVWVRGAVWWDRAHTYPRDDPRQAECLRHVGDLPALSHPLARFTRA